MTERNIKKTLTAGFFAFLASLFFPQVTLKGCRQLEAAPLRLASRFCWGFGFFCCLFFTPWPLSQMLSLSKDFMERALAGKSSN